MEGQRRQRRQRSVSQSQWRRRKSEDSNWSCNDSDDEDTEGHAHESIEHASGTDETDSQRSDSDSRSDASSSDVGRRRGEVRTRAAKRSTQPQAQHTQGARSRQRQTRKQSRASKGSDRYNGEPESHQQDRSDNDHDDDEAGELLPKPPDPLQRSPTKKTLPAKHFCCNPHPKHRRRARRETKRAFFFRLYDIRIMFEEPVPAFFLQVDLGGISQSSEEVEASESLRTRSRVNEEDSTVEETQELCSVYLRALEIKKSPACIFYSTLHGASSKAKVPMELDDEFEGTWRGTDTELPLESLHIRVWTARTLGPNVLIAEHRLELRELALGEIDRDLCLFKPASGELAVVGGKQAERGSVQCKCEFQEQREFNLQFEYFHIVDHKYDRRGRPGPLDLSLKFSSNSRSGLRALMSGIRRCRLPQRGVYLNDVALRSPATNDAVGRHGKSLTYYGTRFWIEDRWLEVSLRRSSISCCPRAVATQAVPMQGVLDSGYLDLNLHPVNEHGEPGCCGRVVKFDDYKAAGVILCAGESQYRQTGNARPHALKDVTYLVVDVRRGKGLVSTHMERLNTRVTVSFNGVQKQTRQQEGLNPSWQEQVYFSIPDRMCKASRPPKVLDDFPKGVRRDAGVSLSVWSLESGFGRTPVGDVFIPFVNILSQRKKKKVDTFLNGADKLVYVYTNMEAMLTAPVGATPGMLSQPRASNCGSIELEIYFDRRDTHEIKPARTNVAAWPSDSNVLKREVADAAQESWSEALSGVPDWPQRLMHLTGIDEKTGERTFLPALLAPSVPPMGMHRLHQLFYYVFSIECLAREEESAEAPWVWTEPSFLLAKGKGDLKSHALLLCNFLLGLDRADVKPWVCIGTVRTERGGQEEHQPHVWVMTQEKVTLDPDELDEFASTPDPAELPHFHHQQPQHVSQQRDILRSKAENPHVHDSTTRTPTSSEISNRQTDPRRSSGDIAPITMQQDGVRGSRKDSEAVRGHTRQEGEARTRHTNTRQKEPGQVTEEGKGTVEGKYEHKTTGSLDRNGACSDSQYVENSESDWDSEDDQNPESETGDYSSSCSSFESSPSTSSYESGSPPSNPKVKRPTILTRSKAGQDKTQRNVAKAGRKKRLAFWRRKKPQMAAPRIRNVVRFWELSTGRTYTLSGERFENFKHGDKRDHAREKKRRAKWSGIGRKRKGKTAKQGEEIVTINVDNRERGAKGQSGTTKGDNNEATIRGKLPVAHQTREPDVRSAGASLPALHKSQPWDTPYVSLDVMFNDTCIIANTQQRSPTALHYQLNDTSRWLRFGPTMKHFSSLAAQINPRRTKDRKIALVSVAPERVLAEEANIFTQLRNSITYYRSYNHSYETAWLDQFPHQQTEVDGLSEPPDEEVVVEDPEEEESTARDYVAELLQGEANFGFRDTGLVKLDNRHLAHEKEKQQQTMGRGRAPWAKSRTDGEVEQDYETEEALLTARRQWRKALEDGLTDKFFFDDCLFHFKHSDANRMCASVRRKCRRMLQIPDRHCPHFVVGVKMKPLPAHICPVRVYLCVIYVHAKIC